MTEWSEPEDRRAERREGGPGWFGPPRETGPFEPPEVRPRERRWPDRVIGIGLGVLLGLAIILLFLFLESRNTIDEPSLSGGRTTQTATQPPTTPTTPGGGQR